MIRCCKALMSNKKSAISIVSRSKYFDPDKDRAVVTFSSPESYQSRNIKIEGYESRLYWQFRYCQDCNGQVFFYTLTYNDANMPKYMGKNCFDYEDLRDLFTGGFRKKLLRNYGTTFKYFVGAELGDGKGERGLHNNPHYHVLFFLEPDKDTPSHVAFPYIKISPAEFRKLIKDYWQGFDETVDGYRDYRTAKYGIAKEGDNDGLVIDYRAISYVAKYVCKDVALKQYEKDIETAWWHKFNSEAEYLTALYKSFFDDYIKRCMLELNDDDLPSNDDDFPLSDSDAVAYLLDSVPIRSRLNPRYDDVDYLYAVPQIIFEYGLDLDFAEFRTAYIAEQIRLKIVEYRNRYCNKCRISQGVGDYALKFMDKDDPYVTVPSKDGFKNRPISMYYYRKLFTDYIVDSKGSVIRFLNDDGIKYRLSRLPEQLKKCEDKAQSYLSLVLSDKNLFVKMVSSDVNTDVVFSFEDFKSSLADSLSEVSQPELIKRYAELKLVYGGRFFRHQSDGKGVFTPFPSIDLVNDYAFFLVPSLYYCSRDDLRVVSFLERDCEDYVAYESHPYFLRFSRVFAVLDLCADYFFVQNDDKAQKKAEEIASVKRFHNRNKVKEYFKYFK